MIALAESIIVIDGYSEASREFNTVDIHVSDCACFVHNTATITARGCREQAILRAATLLGMLGAKVTIKHTPLIAQYLGVKQKVPDAILFFRLGDFYEMFFEDAEIGARILDIQLTSRSKEGVPLCGVPYHSADPYIAKLLKAGFKVAICEQNAPEPAAASAQAGAFQLTAPGSRNLMPRQIVRVITPGTVSEEMVLEALEKSFLVALRAKLSRRRIVADSSPYSPISDVH